VGVGVGQAPRHTKVGCGGSAVGPLFFGVGVGVRVGVSVGVGVGVGVGLSDPLTVTSGAVATQSENEPPL
jgi:hypothetical protein